MQVSDVIAPSRRVLERSQAALSPPLSSLMHDAFAALLRQPTARRYKQLRSRLLAGGLPGDFSLQLAHIERLMEEGELAEAGQLLKELAAAGLLSLRWHRLGGTLAMLREDRDRAELHRFTYDAICEAIGLTGEGTRQRPLRTTYTSDAGEFLISRGLEVLSQSLVEERSHRYDVLLCQGEREFWFDVTDLLPQTAISGAGKQRPPAGASVKPRRKRALSRG